MPADSNPPRRCPCTSGLPYDECCGPLHRGERAAPTAEQLMRSRFSAFALADAAYLLATWHPSTRPESLELEDLEVDVEPESLLAELHRVHLEAQRREGKQESG